MALPVRCWICPHCDEVRSVDDAVLVGDEYWCGKCATEYADSE